MSKREDLRIAFVAPLVTTIAQPYVGGSQAMLADLAQGLTQRGHRITLFARAGSSVPGVPVEPIAVPTSVGPTDFANANSGSDLDAGFVAQCNLFLDLFLNLRQRQHEFDLVHIHAFDWPAFACSTILAGLPVVYTVHLPAVMQEINEGLRILHQRRHPLTLVTVSHACARTYAQYTPFDAVIYNGIDLDAILFAPKVAPNAPLLFAGRITPEKGVEQAIRIALQTERHLLIAGGIYDRRYYQERIEPQLQQHPERLTYLGSLSHEELWKLMGQAHALLFPITWDEPFGLVPIEALASGTPVIAFNRGAAPEVLQHGKTGFLVPPNDCATAAEMVSKIDMIARVDCRKHVEENFSRERMLEGYEGVYNSLDQD